MYRLPVYCFYFLTNQQLRNNNYRKENKRNNYQFDSLTLVVWSSSGYYVPNPTRDDWDEFPDEPKKYNSVAAYKKRLTK